MQQFKEQLVLSIGTKLAVFLYHSQVLSGAGHRQKLRKSIGILETFGGKAMWQRNNGQAEDDLQFRFTAYLVSAVKRRRKDYLIQFYKRSSIESTVEVVYESEPSSEEVVLDRLPLMDVIENGALLEALQKLNERERQIFLARTLEEEDFETLGAKFGLSYKGVAALYYRTIELRPVFGAFHQIKAYIALFGLAFFGYKVVHDAPEHKNLCHNTPFCHWHYYLYKKVPVVFRP